MTREEAIKRLKELRSGNWWAFEDPNEIDITNEALDMAIEALSAEQKEEELANDIARRMATIIENEQDMRIILKNASTELLDDGTLKVNVKSGYILFDNCWVADTWRVLQMTIFGILIGAVGIMVITVLAMER